MNVKKNTGIVLILLGIVLTMDRTNDLKGIVSMIANYMKEYWPFILTFIGIYLLSAPKKSKRK